MIIIRHVNDHPLPRLLEPRLRRALATSPVVVLTGSRQTGKSTLVQSIEPQERRPYVSLDDLDVLARAREVPQALVRAERLTLDEVQRAPELLIAVKREVDAGRRPGRFLLTGSANLLLMRHVSESLAGRSVHLTLSPLTRRERLGQGRAGLWSELISTPATSWPDLLEASTARREDWRTLARIGGYPTPAHELNDEEDRDLWFGGFIRTYLERDLRDLASISSPTDFRRLMRAAALRIGNLINQTELGRDIGVPQPTVHRHLDLLAVSHQLIRLEGYSSNRTTRLIKAPKLYWGDVGLAMHLAGETEPRGAHLENLVLLDALAWAEAHAERPQVCYWRKPSGQEVDLVIETALTLLPVEIKASPRIRLDDVPGLRAFLDEHPRRAPAGLLLHDGKSIEWLTDRILAAPWWRVV